MQFSLDQLESAVGRVSEYVEISLSPSYSGRGMYGRTCVGVVVGKPSYATLFLIALAEEMEEPVLDFVADMSQEMCTDNMGYDVIAYWPRASVSDE